MAGAVTGFAKGMLRMNTLESTKIHEFICTQAGIIQQQLDAEYKSSASSARKAKMRRDVLRCRSVVAELNSFSVHSTLTEQIARKALDDMMFPTVDSNSLS